MKQAILLVMLVSTLCNCQSSKSGDYERIPGNDLSISKLDSAQAIGHKILTAMWQDSFYTLNADEATADMVAGLNEARQRHTYEMLKRMYGKYEGMSFREALRSTTGSGILIQRFLGNFSEDAEVEIRVVFDKENRLAGFFVKPWRDRL